MKFQNLALLKKKLGRFILASAFLAGVLQMGEAFAQSGVWTNYDGGTLSWATAANWTNGIIANGSGDTADFSQLTLESNTIVTQDDGVTNIGNMIFGDQGDLYGWTLNAGSGSGSIGLAITGTPTITVNNQTTTINLALSGGSAGFEKAGAGTLVLTGSGSPGGTTVVAGGILTISGSGSGGASTGGINVGSHNGTGVMNFSSTGSWTLASGGTGNFYVGGTDTAGDNGVGAINQTSGSVSCGSGNFLQLGAGSSGESGAYGSYNLSGGTLSLGKACGTHVGYGGLGYFAQTGGIFSVSPGGNFGLGGYNGTGTTGNGAATFTGGTASIGSTRQIVIPENAGTGVVSVGTESGGNAVVTSLSATGVEMDANSAGGNGTLNLNSGTLNIHGPVYRANNGGSSTAVVNLNGGTLQAGASGINFIAISPAVPSVSVYNGGVTFDTQANSATVPANLANTTGNGLYPAGGTWIVPNGDGGAGYIGPSLVTVSGGSGSGAMAIADVSGGVLTGLTLTCPGQGYLLGDTLSFAFAGGGASSPASTYMYTLQSSDLATNGTGVVTKIGSGTLTLSGANTYAGGTSVAAGTLSVTSFGGMGTGNILVAPGATLDWNGGIPYTCNLVISPTSTINLTNGTTINCLSLDGGMTYVQPGTYGGSISGAANIEPEFGSTAPGVLTVSSFLNTAPTNILCSVSGGNLNLSWPTDHIGWQLETETNLSQHDWTIVPGSSATNQVSIPINPSTPAQYFQLVYINP